MKRRTTRTAASRARGPEHQRTRSWCGAGGQRQPRRRLLFPGGAGMRAAAAEAAGENNEDREKIEPRKKNRQNECVT